MKNQIKLNPAINERFLVESCLNLAHSGYDYSIYLAFYALSKRWHINKLIYYVNLIEGSLNG